jgi:hypothetical protein
MVSHGRWIPTMTEFSVLRRQAGVTVSELAAQLGFPEPKIIEWDEGRAKAPKHILHVLGFMGGGASATEQQPIPASPHRQHAFPWSVESQTSETPKSITRSGAFTDNMKLPIHRWFRYSAGFSADWVAQVIQDHRLCFDSPCVFDPFVGSGTALLAAQSAGVRSAGAERHPFVARIARAKLAWQTTDHTDLRSAAHDMLERAAAVKGQIHTVPDLLSKCYSPEALLKLFALRTALEQSNSDTRDLLWLALTAILRECSGVGTAQWQYVLPNKSKARVANPFDAFTRCIEMFCSDIAFTQRTAQSSKLETCLHEDDARTLHSFDDLRGQVSLVVTSPPYPNNYDYADATRLEMTFWGDVQSWGDLHRTVRHKLVRSCSQHTAAERLTLEHLLDDPMVQPIQTDLTRVCNELAEIRETKGGKKAYHTMVAAYFGDLARVWHALRPLCVGGADVCFVIGDSAPYGIYVPADDWLSELAQAAGFHSPRFEKIRDRNLKWKNRKHRVPLKEGNLWLKG